MVTSLPRGTWPSSKAAPLSRRDTGVRHPAAALAACTTSGQVLQPGEACPGCVAQALDGTQGGSHGVVMLAPALLLLLLAPQPSQGHDRDMLLPAAAMRWKKSSCG